MMIPWSTTALNVYRDGLRIKHSGIQQSLLQNRKHGSLREQEMVWKHKLIGEFLSSSKLSRVF